MAMNKVYTRINWEDYPSENTSVDEENLNRMDSAIDTLDNLIISQNAVKVDKTTINDKIADWTMDEETGIITITKYSGEKLIFDLNVEKIPVSFTLSDDGILTMTTEDGTKFTADIGSMIPVLTFNDSDTIAVSVTGTGKNKTYSFAIKTGSVTENMLQPNFLADVTVQAGKASGAASDAANSAIAAKTSESNAKASETAASSNAFAAKESETNAKNSENSATESKQAASSFATSAEGSKNAAATSATNASSYAAAALKSQTAAKNSETNAAASATNASSYAAAAQTSETNAAKSEKVAKESQNSAKTSEDNAKASETSAVSSATSATNSAKNASSSASAAKTSETNAKASETAAKSSQTASKTSETNASKSASTAQTSAKTATDNATLAKSYTVGGTGTRTGEDTDNAKYYMEQAKQQTGGIPKKVSELENDSGYITNSVSDLSNYYSKTQTDTKLSSYLTKTGDGSNLTETFTQATTLANIASGESHSTIFGKIMKAIADFITHKSTSATSSVLGHVKVDSSLSSTSTNPVQNKVINAALNGKLSTTGNASNATTAFTESTELSELTSGEKLSASMGKLKLAVKNLKTLIALMGTTDITAIGDGTVTGAVSEVNTSIVNLGNNEAIKDSAVNSYIKSDGSYGNIDYDITSLNSKLGMQMYTLDGDSYLNKSLTDIILEMPDRSELLNPYIKCSEQDDIIKLGFSQYSVMKITKYDNWSIVVMIIGNKGTPIGFWEGNKNQITNILSDMKVFK